MGVKMFLINSWFILCSHGLQLLIKDWLCILFFTGKTKYNAPLLLVWELEIIGSESGNFKLMYIPSKNFHSQSTVLTLVKMYGSDFLCEEEGKIWQMRFASFFDEYQCILSEIWIQPNTNFFIKLNFLW